MSPTAGNTSEGREHERSGAATPTFDADQSFHPGVLHDDEEIHVDMSDGHSEQSLPKGEHGLVDPFAGLEEAWMALRAALGTHMQQGMPTREFNELAAIDYDVRRFLNFVFSLSLFLCSFFFVSSLCLFSLSLLCLCLSLFSVQGTVWFCI